MRFSKSAIAVMGLSIVMLTGATTAYAAFIGEQSVHNVFTMSNVDISIVEDYDPPEGFGPGSEFTKRVAVANNSTSDVYVRVKLVFSTGILEDASTLDFDETSWQYNPSDGYWYYRYKVLPGKTSAPLFNRVQISNSVNINDLGAFELYVYAEAAQADGFDNARAVFDYLGEMMYSIGC